MLVAVLFKSIQITDLLSFRRRILVACYQKNFELDDDRCRRLWILIEPEHRSKMDFRCLRRKNWTEEMLEVVLENSLILVLVVPVLRRVLE